MAGGSKQFQRDFRKWQAQLMKAVDPATFHEKVQEKYLPEIVNAIVGSAKAGIGPENAQYAAYKPSYAATKAKGKWQLWLSVSGDMLDPKRFSMVIHASTGRAWLRWEGPVHGAVHQGDEYGGASDTRGNIEPRPWFHFDNDANFAAYCKAYELAQADIAAAFNAGTLK